MTQTTNIGLKKIDGSENWRQIFDYHNDSADKTDSAVAAVQDGLAIVANGDTHAAVAEGQFVYVRNHSTLAEGLYKASSAISTNAELSTSNLTADGSGGLNDLQEQVTSLNSKITISSRTTLIDSNIAVSGDTTWQSSGNLQFAGNYKKYFIRIGVHGATYNSVIVDADLLPLVNLGQAITISAFWDSGNLGQIRLYGNTCDIIAKTKDHVFDYTIYGLN